MNGSVRHGGEDPDDDDEIAAAWRVQGRVLCVLADAIDEGVRPEDATQWALRILHGITG